MRLCKSDDEFRFIEALVVHVTHKLINMQDGDIILMTDDQLRQIAADRRGDEWRPWNHADGPAQVQVRLATGSTRHAV